MRTEIRPLKVKMMSEMQKPGRFRLVVAVTAKDAPTERRTFVLVWDGSPSGMSLIVE
jgi:hypothetical protein